ncbi:hypothetical protein VC83_07577 [Pseudogymnoascus destructans]|uniref:Uncharacterized protein n=1 Tax=Pseudogymnoascus destructans TaxID=655981 RepID=A0A176ZZQ6_9PEZI|nr:uncharacterized protein VC83_07577 [Pseudogymnoascus destructans]OAF55509.1 hypothetical protein VC83_07577 [Pseudogymnoascus destructans]
MVGLLKVKLTAKNATDNNVSFGMPIDLGQNMGANTTNMKWAINTDKNMTGIVSASGNETSTGDIYNIDEEGGYQGSAFGPHFTQHPWACLNVLSTTVASGNLYTTDLINSFYGELRAVPQIPPPYAYLQRRNETHMLLFDTPSVQSMSDDNSATITTVVSYPNAEQLQ